MEKRVPFKITKICDSGERLLLQFFDYRYPAKLFETLLLHPGLADAFREAVRSIHFKNDNKAHIHLTFYGFTPEGDLIISI
jgi:hypothetical protein